MTSSSYRTPHEVRAAIDGMGGGDWLQRSIQFHSAVWGGWDHDKSKSIPAHGPPSIRTMAERRYTGVVDGLRDAGLKILGKGAYGTVFELRLDDPWVYKLVAVPSNGPYLSYIRWAREQRTGPRKREAWVRCLPRAKVLFEDRWFALVRVERLVAQCRSDATAYGGQGTIAYRAVPDLPIFKPYLEATNRILAEGMGTNDMHVANIMLRRTKCGGYEPVHTDPVC